MDVSHQALLNSYLQLLIELSSLFTKDGNLGTNPVGFLPITFLNFFDFYL